MALMGIDVGSSGCKAIVFSNAGEQLAEHYIEYPHSDNQYEIDGNLIWENVKSTIIHCTKMHSKNPSKNPIGEKITAISISSFGESFVPVDKNGQVLMNTMLYTDKRGKPECDALVEKLGEEKIMKITGVKPQPMYSLAKMIHIKENYPEIYEKTYKFLLIGSFVIYKLTDETVIDYSLAARTMAFDVINKKWSEEILDLAGIDINKLAQVMPSGTITGQVKFEIATQLGLAGLAGNAESNDESKNEGIKVVTGGHDQICAALGAGVIDSSIAIDGTGTVECITPIFDRPILENSFLGNNYACVPYVIDGMYATYAFNFTGGAILKWFKNNFAKFESLKAKEQGISVYKLLDENASKTPTDLIVVPHFAGSATPDMNEDARGAFMGMTFDTDTSILYRAMIEGVTYEMLYNLEILEENGILIKELRAVGGGAKSSLWLQIKADITGKTIVSLETQEAGIVGAVILAGVATGVYKDLEVAAKVFVKSKKRVEPDPANEKIYQINYQRYKKIRKLIEKIYKEENEK